MIEKIAVCGAALLLAGTGGSGFATPAHGTASWGDCPAKVAQQAVSVAEKQCKLQGGEVLVTYLNCEDGTASMNWLCV